MTILIVDDETDVRRILTMRLRAEGFDIDAVASAESAFEHLNDGDILAEHGDIDLILMDILMPDMSGIEACQHLKGDPRTEAIPVIMMTASHDMEHLEEAFKVGAIDYLTKPFSKVELLARIGSALRIKSEIDKRRDNERKLMLTTEQLKIVNSNLERLSVLDGLTGLYNRRFFDDALVREYRRALRNCSPIALIMADIDWFKSFNDKYGHLAGDDCLRRVAGVFGALANRSHDLVARYGGEEFAVILPETPLVGVMELAEDIRCHVEALQTGDGPDVSMSLSVSLGVTSIVPERHSQPQELIRQADEALYQSKKLGRNRVTASPRVQH